MSEITTGILATPPEKLFERAIEAELRSRDFGKTFFWKTKPLTRIKKIGNSIFEIDEKFKRRDTDEDLTVNAMECADRIERAFLGEDEPKARRYPTRDAGDLISEVNRDQGRLDEVHHGPAPVNDDAPPAEDNDSTELKEYRCGKCGRLKRGKTTRCPQCNPKSAVKPAAPVAKPQPSKPKPMPKVKQPTITRAEIKEAIAAGDMDTAPKSLADLIQELQAAEGRVAILKIEIVTALGGVMPGTLPVTAHPSPPPVTQARPLQNGAGKFPCVKCGTGKHHSSAACPKCGWSNQQARIAKLSK